MGRPARSAQHRGATSGRRSNGSGRFSGACQRFEDLGVFLDLAARRFGVAEAQGFVAFVGKLPHGLDLLENPWGELSVSCAGQAPPGSPRWSTLELSKTAWDGPLQFRQAELS